MAPTLHDVRFAADRELFEALLKDEHLAGPLQSHAAYEHHRKIVRMHLLSSAVRVDARMLPKLAASIDAMHERAHYEGEVEAYVFEDPAINAFMAEGEKRTFLGISSGAVNGLSGRELEFVIGHELGHAFFRHADAHAILQNEEDLSTTLRKKIYAWRRASEISADRCGLVCCGDLDIAATAMFRTLSGLGDKDLSVHAEDFAEQWDHLLDEVIRGGDDDLWENSHPFPPLRMKAMLLLWRSDAALLPPDRPAPTRTLEHADEEVRRLLSTMDPLARKEVGRDPVLEDFWLWGGLCLATTQGIVDARAKETLKKLVARGAIEQSLQEENHHLTFFTHFYITLKRRRKRLRSLDKSKILKRILRVDHAKGDLSERDLSERDVKAFNAIGERLGISEEACDLVRERYRDTLETP